MQEWQLFNRNFFLKITKKKEIFVFTFLGENRIFSARAYIFFNPTIHFYDANVAHARVFRRNIKNLNTFNYVWLYRQSVARVKKSVTYSLLFQFNIYKKHLQNCFYFYKSETWFVEFIKKLYTHTLTVKVKEWAKVRSLIELKR